MNWKVANIKSAKQAIKSLLRKRFGIVVHKFKPDMDATAQIVSSLKRFNIDLVFDVGANEGQFASDIRGGGYTGNIISFEPILEAHNSLKDASRDDDKWFVHSRCALGDHVGEVNINIAGNSASSSLLSMHENHLLAAPHTAYIGKQSVPLLTLDSIAQGYLMECKNPFLKIDTQGYEWKVLDGAENILPSIRGVLVELSLIRLYEGQHLWEDVIVRMKEAGFTVWALQQGFTDPRDGRSLQMDGVFFRMS